MERRKGVFFVSQGKNLGLLVFKNKYLTTMTAMMKRNVDQTVTFEGELLIHHKKIKRNKCIQQKAKSSKIRQWSGMFS